MSITTQEQALATIRATATRLGQLTDRYDSGGAAVKAQAARDMAAAFTVLATVYGQLPKLFSGRRAAPALVDFAAADAAELNQRRAEEWGRQAEVDQAKADAIERQAAPVFADDGMVFVPGVGRVKRVDADYQLRLLDGDAR